MKHDESDKLRYPELGRGQKPDTDDDKNEQNDL
jgi:hypothetical protein